MGQRLRDRSGATVDHVVCFYANDAELAEAVVREQLAPAVDADEVVILFSTADHRSAFEAEAATLGVDLGEARHRGRFVSLDAAETLAQLVVADRVDSNAFRDVVGDLVRAAAGSGRPVRIFGEMVALLWSKGDVLGAIELESLWNRLLQDHRFSLFCAYRIDPVGGPERAEACAQVCDLHSNVLRLSGSAGPSPLLSEAEAHAEFSAERETPRAARRLVTDTLRAWGCSDLVDDAALIISELATNAVLHVGLAYSVIIHATEGRVRLSVRDANHEIPTVGYPEPKAPSGRGLGIVATLADRWGVDRVVGGKVVWAELKRPAAE